MKNLVIAILVAILITYCFGNIAHEWFDISVTLDDEILTPFEALAGVTIAGIVLTVVGVIVAVSLFGVLFAVTIAVVMAVVIAGISALWPMFLVLAAVIWLVKDKKEAQP